MIELHLGDCRELLKAYPDGQFDLCMADPPYGDTSLSWDSVVDGWVPAVSRVLKPVSSIWVFGSMRFFTGNRIRARMRAEGFRYSQDIVWEKQNGTGFHADRFRRVHEHAVLFYRGAWADVHHETQYTDDATKRSVRRKRRPTHTGHIESGHYVSEDGGPRMMRSVVYERNEHGRAIHPTQKPLGLLRPMVRYSCPPGGSVVVPFGGSGSELIAAREEQRFAVGFENNPKHYADAQQRMREHEFGDLA